MVLSCLLQAYSRLSMRCRSRPSYCFPQIFPSNNSKAFQPLAPLKTHPAYASLCVTTLFVRFRFSCFIFLKTCSFATCLSAFVYGTTVQMRQFVYLMFSRVSCFRMRISMLTTLTVQHTTIQL